MIKEYVLNVAVVLGCILQKMNALQPVFHAQIIVLGVILQRTNQKTPNMRMISALYARLAIISFLVFHIFKITHANNVINHVLLAIPYIVANHVQLDMNLVQSTKS